MLFPTAPTDPELLLAPLRYLRAVSAETADWAYAPVLGWARWWLDNPLADPDPPPDPPPGDEDRQRPPPPPPPQPAYPIATWLEALRSRLSAATSVAAVDAVLADFASAAWG